MGGFFEKVPSTLNDFGRKRGVSVHIWSSRMPDAEYEPGPLSSTTFPQGRVGGKLHSVTGSWQQVKHGLSVRDTTNEAPASCGPSGKSILETQSGTQRQKAQSHYFDLKGLKNISRFCPQRPNAVRS